MAPSLRGLSCIQHDWGSVFFFTALPPSWLRHATSLTEGGEVRECPSFYFFLYHGTNTVKIFINIQIAESDYFQTALLQLFCPYFIFLFRFRMIMATAI